MHVTLQAVQAKLQLRVHAQDAEYVTRHRNVGVTQAGLDSIVTSQYANQLVRTELNVRLLDVATALKAGRATTAVNLFVTAKQPAKVHALKTGCATIRIDVSALVCGLGPRVTLPGAMGWLASSHVAAMAAVCLLINVSAMKDGSAHNVRTQSVDCSINPKPARAMASV